MIVVIGGGPAGRYAAMRLAGAGREVTLVDRRKEGLGGQCLHQGCMVICALNDVARTLEHQEVLYKSGVITSIPVIDFPALVSAMQEIIKTISRVIEDETREAGVQIIYGEARTSSRTVMIDGNPIDAESVIIATGSKPHNPAIPGDELPGVYTAHNILSLPALPKRLVIIGGGAIATELAYLFSVFGSQVSILVRSTLLRSFPESLIREAKHDLHRAKIYENTSVSRITGEDRVSGVEVVTPEGPLTIGADAVLLAVGMKPNIESISGVAFSPDGYIAVNDRMETSVKGVYAAGDVTESSWLTPLARRQGRIAADAILGIDPPAPLTAVPQAIKLRNDLAYCGEQSEGPVTVRIPSPVGPGSFWAVPDRATGRTSLTIDPDSGLLLGMVEASPYASVVSAYHALLMNTGAKINQMERFIEVHPSADGTGWTGRYLAEYYERKRREE